MARIDGTSPLHYTCFRDVLQTSRRKCTLLGTINVKYIYYLRRILLEPHYSIIWSVMSCHE